MIINIEGFSCDTEDIYSIEMQEVGILFHFKNGDLYILTTLSFSVSKMVMKYILQNEEKGAEEITILKDLSEY